MVTRTNRKTHDDFTGCSRFPQCRWSYQDYETSGNPPWETVEAPEIVSETAHAGSHGLCPCGPMGCICGEDDVLPYP